MAKAKGTTRKKAVSALSPVNRKGIKGITLAQEASMFTNAYEPGKYGAPATEFKNGQYGRFAHHYLANCDPRTTWSARVFWGATGLKVILGILRPGKPPLRAGILQVC